MKATLKFEMHPLKDVMGLLPPMACADFLGDAEKLTIKYFDSKQYECLQDELPHRPLYFSRPVQCVLEILDQIDSILTLRTGYRADKILVEVEIPKFPKNIFKPDVRGQGLIGSIMASVGPKEGLITILVCRPSAFGLAERNMLADFIRKSDSYAQMLSRTEKILRMSDNKRALSRYVGELNEVALKWWESN